MGTGHKKIYIFCFYKCLNSAVSGTLLLALKDRYALDMRRLWELVYWLDWLCYMVALVSKTLDIAN